MQLQFLGLPPGVRASPVFVHEDQFWVPAVLEADSDAELKGSLAELRGNCSSGEALLQSEFSQTVDLVHSTADQLFHSVTVDRLPVAVTPPVPFRVELDNPNSALPSGGRLQVNFSVKREAGFDEPVRVRLPFLPPWVVSEAHIVVPKGVSTGSFQLEADAVAEARTWTLVATATVDTLTAEEDTSTLDGRSVCSSPVDLEICEAPVQGVFEELAGSRGDEIIAVCKLESKELVGNFTATLEGLPNRVSAQPVRITGNNNKIRFRIEVAEDAPLGLFERLQCRLTSQGDESPVSYVVAPRTKLRLMAPENLKRDADGKLLSPLEALRTRQ